MDIKGLDYNTQREPLVMPEYGREIQLMVEYAIALPSREERLRCATAIVKQMEFKVPDMHDNATYQQTLWDHLYLMSQGKLDIDWPYDVSNAGKINNKPQPVPLPKGKIHLRHYGRMIEESLQRLSEMPDGPERTELIRLTANQMKRDLVQWGHGSIDDEKVADDMARMTNGAVQLDLDTFKFERIKTQNEPTPSKKSKKRR